MATRQQVDNTTAQLREGDRVRSEFGAGTVVKHTRRCLVYRLDTGEMLNVVTGTPGYCRIKPEMTSTS